MVRKSPRRTHRTHTPAFNAQVAVAALRQDRPLAELTKHFELHPTQIVEWKRQLLGHAAEAFGGGAQAAEPVDLKADGNVSAARADIAAYLAWYNTHRPHSSLERSTPGEKYFTHAPQMKLAA